MAQRVRTIQLKKIEKVDLSGLFLDFFPSLTINMTLISKLDLSNNSLKSIPEYLTTSMINVLVLDVHSNQLKSLPNSIGCLTKLKVLNVSGNLLESLPKAIEDCRALQELNANFNTLTKLPQDIGLHLVNLQKLSVNSNKLLFLPDTISNITSLRILDARLNCLRALPIELENLINLEVLNISQNFHYLNSLPSSVGLLISLVELDASYNKITALPNSIVNLRKLRKLSVEGNPLICPPKEVVDQSLQAVKEYLRNCLNGVKPSNPTKRGAWMRKLAKYRSFNVRRTHDRLISDYQAIDDGLVSRRYMRGFSSCCASSPRSYFST